MEKIDIQISRSSFNRVEDVIANVCYDNHIDNYQAIVSVSVLSVINSMFDLNPDALIRIVCKYTVDGLSFRIFNPSEPLSHNVDFSQSDKMVRSADSVVLRPEVHALADMVSFDGSSVSLLFWMRGINSREAERRRHVLENFYCLELNVV